MKNEYRLFDKTDFGKIYNKMTENSGLIAALVQMQTDMGINERKAYETADDLSHRVAVFVGCESLLREDTEEVLDDFLAYSEKLQGYDRKLLLHQLSFGLHLYQDADLIERLKEGSTIDELFREYYAVYGEDPAYSEDFLATQIRREASAFCISPKVMKAIAKKLEKSDNLVAASAALSEEGNRFKCIVAMNLYLNNQDTMSIDDAVSTACTDIEVEAVADAVARGQMTADTAHKILTALCITTVLAALITLTGGLFAHDMKLLELSRNLFLGIGVVAIVENAIAGVVGKLGSRYHFYYSKGTHSAADDLEYLANEFSQMYAAKNEERDTAAWTTEEDVEEEEVQEDHAVLI